MEPPTPTPRPSPAATLTPSWRAERTPDAPAIVLAGRDGSDESVSYAELEDRSTRMARALRQRGIAAGEHIAILLGNERPFLEVAWAAQRSGLHYTAINSHLRPAEVQYVLDDCGARALVTSEAMAEVVAGLDLARIPIRVVAGDPPSLRAADGDPAGDGVVAGGPPSLTEAADSDPAGGVVGDLPGFERYDEVLAAAGPGRLDDEREGREMLYSSGTTGRPKGVRKQLPGTPFGDPTSARSSWPRASPCSAGE